MRLSLISSLACAAFVAGCNSQPPTASASDPTPPPPTAPAERTAFRDRATNAPPAPIPTNIVAMTRVNPARTVSQRPNVAPGPGPADAAPAEHESTTAEAAPINPDDLPEEGDQILVAPQFLGALLPGVNLETLARTEPVNIKSLLESRGIEVTNYQQLIEMGVTNYQILRAPKPAPAAAQTAK